MSALALALAAVLAMNPFEKNDPLIDEGTSLYEKGRFEEALQKFDQAGTQYPQDPRVSYNRGLALHKLGKYDDAKQALQRALELDRDGSLAGKSHYNLGNVAAAAGDKKLALREYREALKKNPQDELARHNYEVILKDLPPEKSNGDAGTPDGGHADAGRPDAGQDGGANDAGADAGKPDAGTDAGIDGGVDGGQPDGGPGDGGQDAGADGGQGDAGQGDGGHGDGGQGDKDKQADAGQKGEDQKPGDGGADAGDEDRDGGSPQEAEGKMLPDGGVDLSKQDAERLLDSMKNTEKNMQLWRFRQKSTKSSPNGKDW